MTSRYRPIFDPESTDGQAVVVKRRSRPDAAPPTGYVYDDAGRIAFAVNVALATGRPLLVRGHPGTGKTSLGLDVAGRLGWRYYEFTTTSRTRAADLQWSFDAVRRLSDASRGIAHDPSAYLDPGVLWWAFQPATAAARGLDDAGLAAAALERLPNPSPLSGDDAVVVIDEIDKADPDVPNDLLLPLGALRFEVTDVETGRLTVTAERSPLVIVTTNEERDLPPAFLRRCIVLRLPHPGDQRLKAIAVAHFGEGATPGLLDALLPAYHQIRKNRLDQDHEPNPAEFLDAVSAVIGLKISTSDSSRWQQLLEFALRKPGMDDAARSAEP